MNLGVKIGIGVGVAALVGVGIYFGFIRKTEEAVGDAGGVGSPPAGGTGVTPPAGAPNYTNKDAPKKVKKDCNKAFPAPRIAKAKVAGYKACIAAGGSAADGSTGCTVGADGDTWACCDACKNKTL